MSTDHPKRIGTYDVLGKIGEGGMGSVYKGVQQSLNRVVAIKVLSDHVNDETSVERFRREAKAVAMLNHPNVVQIIEMSESEATPYFVMEYVKGTSLDSIMQRRRLSLTEALSVFKEVCKGLQAAHRQDIIHRDLNPRNVLVSEDLSMVKLADFGISRVESVSRTQGTLSTGSVAMGTLHYMAPEQSSGMEGVDHRADIYALGVLLYEMLTGRVPVGRFNLPSQLEETVPPELDPLVLRCLNADPADRFPSVDRVLEAVRKLEDQLRLSFAQDFRGLSRSTSRLFSRSTSSIQKGSRKWVLIVGGLAIVAAAAFFMRASFTGPGGPARTVELTERYRETDAIADEAIVPVPLPEPGGANDDVATTAPAVAPEPVSAPTNEPLAEEPEAPVVDYRAELEAAIAKAKAGLDDQALADLDEMSASGSPEAASAALLERARILDKIDREEGAMASLIELETKYPGGAEAAEAIYRLGVLQRSQGRPQWQAARDTFARVGVRDPNTKWLPAALRQQADLELELKLAANDERLGKRVPLALVTLRTLVERFPRDAATEEGAWQLAELYEGENFDGEAAAAYALVGTNFPSTRLDAWWKAGQLYEKVDSEAEAIAAYQQVPESSRRHSAAQRRLRKLE